MVFVLQLGVFALIAQIPYEGIACEDYKTIDTSRLVLSYEFLQVSLKKNRMIIPYLKLEGIIQDSIVIIFADMTLCTRH